jgi:hypothetical protein
MTMTMTRIRNERGTALVEAAITIPILLLIAIGIFEFGRAYQTWQVMTNAAREGARVAVTPGSTDGDVAAIVSKYLEDGGVERFKEARININRNAALAVGTGSLVSVTCPFDFIVLQPIAQLVKPSSKVGEPITMGASAIMRNEAAY